ncbi:MAG TPA: EamA family transporter [Steroidobacteraceae bacterium]|jgi:drug/metabolite transporter (DMT)-like permease|nr:EamA family transporter [Steroidobacteraceae bacterium]
MARRPATTTLLCFAVIYVIWGTTFLANTLLLRTVPPFIGGAARFLVAGALLYGWLRLRDPRPFAGLPWGGTALCGVLLTGIGNGFVIWAQIALPSGITSLFIGALPVAILLLDWACFARRAPRALAALGVALGLAGVVVLTLHTQSIAGAVHPIYVAAVLAAVFAWALGTLLQPRYVGARRVIPFTCLQMWVGAVFQLLMAWVDHEWRGFTPAAVSAQSLMALGYLAVFGSVATFCSYAWLVARVAPQKIATYALVNPVIALALGTLVLGERLTPAAIISTVLVLLGVGLVLLQREPARPPAAAGAPGTAGTGAG